MGGECESRCCVCVARQPAARSGGFDELDGEPLHPAVGGDVIDAGGALNVLYLAVREQITPRARDVNHVAAHWKKALNQFSLFFEDRLNTK